MLLRQSCNLLQVLLWAHLRGNNQGFLKIPAGAVALPSDAAPVETLVSSESISLLNGNQGYGMVVMLQATQEAIDKAQRSGIGIVGTNNTSSSTGALG